jgi:hypothetical protein
MIMKNIKNFQDLINKRSLGGKIVIESELDIDSTVTLTLPRESKI